MAQEVVPAQQGEMVPIRRASEACSKGLWTLLSAGEDSQGAIRLIRLNQTLRDELRRVLPVLQERCRPATQVETLKVLVENAPALGIPDRRPEEWATLFRSYMAALDGLTVEALEDAFVRWNRGEAYPEEPKRHAFYPKPAEIFLLAQRSRLELAAAAWRGKKALENADREAPQVSPEEKVRQRQELIDKGYLTAEGRIVLQPKEMPKEAPRVSETRQQMVDRLRQAAERQATSPGASEESV
jgi:hypothetical protein